MALFIRRMKSPTKTFFLFGPRGVGKSTWLKQEFKNSLRYDFLKTSEVLRINQHPDDFSSEVLALPAHSWVVVDEIQKIPTLLNEIHSLLFEHKDHAQYAITSSSARKLKKAEVNLLAGRAIVRHFFPLNAQEMNYDFDLKKILRFGCLPDVVLSKGQEIDILNAYVGTYINEEVKLEALVRSLEGFSRFLGISAIMNAQVLNLANISNDARVKRSTAQGYFQILLDTLIGFLLPAWQPRAKVKEVEHPKYYYFDTGVVRALGGKIYDPPSESELDFLFETYVLHELRSYINDANCGGELYYWRTHSQKEVDFIWQRGVKAVGIEVKHTDSWKSSFGSALEDLLQSNKIKSAYGVYNGKREMKIGRIHVFPVFIFLKKLNSGEILEGF